MAVTLQPQGVGTLGYPFYVADFAADAPPVPTVADATLFVLETRRTFVWRNGAWVLFAENAQAAAALTSSAAAWQQQLLTWAVRELRAIRALLAQAQGMPPLFDPLPEVDVNS